MPDEFRIGKLGGRLVVTWWDDHGTRHRHRLKAQSRKEAEVEAVAIVRQHVIKADHCTCDQLWEAYRKEKEGRRIATTMDFEWRYMKPFFGHLRPDQVTIDFCRAYVAVRRGMGKQDGTIWTEMGHLRTVFRWAADRGHIRHAPAVERPQKPMPKERWLTEAEIRRLLDAPKAHHIQLAILLMLSTAGRIGAILELKWDRVNFETGHVNLRTNDTGPRKGRAVVPMNAGLRAALSQAKQAAITDYVVEWSGNEGRLGSIKTGFSAAAIAAGFKETTKSGTVKASITPHTLRHTAAVHLVANGVKMERVSQYLGHSSTHITEKVYGRFAPDHLRDEAAILDFTQPARIA